METINDRIAACIKASTLTKTEFAKRLNLSQPFVSQLTSGASAPSDRTIYDICREFRVDEIWLRTGEGEMFRKLSRRSEIASFMGDVLAGENDFKQRLIAVLARLDAEQWELLEKVAQTLVEEMQKEKTDL